MVVPASVVPTARFAAADVGRLATLFGLELNVPGNAPVRAGCPVLEMAGSGAMWLTGPPGGPPAAVEGPMMAHLRTAAAGIEELSGALNETVVVDPAIRLSERASERGFRRGGQQSANGSCRLIRATDRWVAVNLSRAADREAVPAVTGRDLEDPWEDLAHSARRLSASELAARAQLVGIPAAELGVVRSPAPFHVTRLGAASPGGPRRRPRVVDFSAMWAGPLCAHLLGAAGASVVKVEDPRRPDAARLGTPGLYSRLHLGHEVLSLDLGTDGGRRQVHELVDSADLVIEASRPRALAQHGLTPAHFLEQRPNRTWISITGYGRSGSWGQRVAFGDDAAAAGGLVAWMGPDTPVFCADAVADPIAGLYAALGALASLRSGGGYLVDVSMAAASAFVLRGPRCRAHHAVEADASGGWWVSHDDISRPVVPPAAAS